MRALIACMILIVAAGTYFIASSVGFWNFAIGLFWVAFATSMIVLPTALVAYFEGKS